MNKLEILLKKFQKHERKEIILNTNDTEYCGFPSRTQLIFKFENI